MTVPYLKTDEFLDYLKERGCEIASDKFTADYGRIILEKDGYAFPFQLKPVYYYPMVVKTCQDLEIEPPADHLKCYEQQMALYNRKKN